MLGKSNGDVERLPPAGMSPQEWALSIVLQRGIISAAKVASAMDRDPVKVGAILGKLRSLKMIEHTEASNRSPWRAVQDGAVSRALAPATQRSLASQEREGAEDAEALATREQALLNALSSYMPACTDPLAKGFWDAYQAAAGEE